MKKSEVLPAESRKAVGIQLHSIRPCCRGRERIHPRNPQESPFDTIRTPRGRTLALGALAPHAWNHAETPGATAVARGRLLALDMVSAAQAKADSIYQLGGSRAPMIMEGESLRAYRLRLLAPMKGVSPSYAKVDSASLKNLPPEIFSVTENQIYNDADKSGRNPIAGGADGALREYFVVDAAGRRTTCFAGTRSFIHDFAGTRQRVVAIHGVGKHNPNI